MRRDKSVYPLADRNMQTVRLAWTLSVSLVSSIPLASHFNLPRLPAEPRGRMGNTQRDQKYTAAAAAAWT